ncbi:MAG TPA: hypothetical protein DDX98_02445 [Bacteroidales bacterium]|nr:hypothetical protein [Bacteroidales bacterium]
MLTWINSNWASQPYIPYPSSNNDAKAAFNEFKEKPEVLFQPEAEERNMYENNATGLNYVKHEKQSITWYPNPAQDAIYLQWNEAEQKKIQVKIYNTHTQLLFSRTISKNQEAGRIDLTMLENGIYFIQVIADGKLLAAQMITKFH